MRQVREDTSGINLYERRWLRPVSSMSDTSWTGGLLPDSVLSVEPGNELGATALQLSVRLPRSLATGVPAPLDQILAAAANEATLQNALHNVLVRAQLVRIDMAAVRAEVGGIELGDDVVILQVSKFVAPIPEDGLNAV